VYENAHKENMMNNNQSIIPRPPVHYLSSLLTVVLDNVWGLPEMGAAATGVGILGLPFLSIATGLSCFLGVFAIQKFVVGDSAGTSFAKALVMGVIAGVPFQVTGTAVGGALLGWSGLSGLGRLLGGGPRPQQPPVTLPPESARRLPPER
jgi:hypothetical protein